MATAQSPEFWKSLQAAVEGCYEAAPWKIIPGELPPKSIDSVCIEIADDNMAANRTLGHENLRSFAVPWQSFSCRCYRWCFERRQQRCSANRALARLMNRTYYPPACMLLLRAEPELDTCGLRDGYQSERRSIQTLQRIPSASRGGNQEVPFPC